jgi:Tol biopolymer transport system component
MSSREAQMLAWHPTKRQLLIVTNLGDAPQIHLVEAPGRGPKPITSLPPPGVRRLPFVSVSFDPADPNTFVFPGGQTGAQSLYRYDMTKGQTSLVADTKSRYPPVWSRQGGWLAYDSTERNGKDRDLYVMQPSEPKSARRVAEVTGAWAPEDWSPDGSRLLASELVSNFETYIWLINVKTGQRKALTPREGEAAAWSDPRFSADGRQVYALNDKDDGARVWRCDLATGAWTPVTSDRDRVDATTVRLASSCPPTADDRYAGRSRLHQHGAGDRSRHDEAASAAAASGRCDLATALAAGLP